MPRTWACTQCGSSVSTGVLSGEPEACEKCDNDEFREVGGSAVTEFVDDPGEFLRNPRTRRRVLLGGGAVVLAGGAVWWTNLRPQVVSTSDVAMKDGRFDPRNIEVDVGTEVTWTNEANAPEGMDPPTYTLASATDGWEFEEEVPPGESTSHTFEEAGQYAAYVHGSGDEDLEGMAMKIGVGESVEDPLTG